MHKTLTGAIMGVMKKIVLPEGNDERVQLAARKLMSETPVAHPILIGNKKKIIETLGESDRYTAIEPDDSENTVWQGGQMVRDDEADGIVAGAVFSTSDVLRAYLKTIGTAADVSRATSCFLMEKGEKRYLFADCGMNIAPDADTLAESAYLCSKFAPLVDIDPAIAFISFSTYGSAKHETVDKMNEALALTRKRWPELVVDGELQIDAAVVPTIAAAKAPESPLKGQATILIFPDLNAGNIAYKVAERFGGYKATGPLLLGLAKPAHDLSRGCNADDIVSAVSIAVKQA